MTTLTDAELDNLAAQVDDQLNALQAKPETFAAARKLESEPSKTPLPAPEQQAVIEQATGKNFQTFWDEFRRLAREDLCLPGGYLHEQWQKWRDLDTKDAVKSSVFWLTAMGVSAQVLNPVAVAATVILLNTLLSIGIKAICEGCE